MTKSKSLYHLVLAGVLCAIGIIIPMFSPIKIRLDPMSFTLASHVAVFLAMFISPAVGVAVSLGTTLGFFLGGFPLPVVLRALSHIIFAAAGAIYLRKRPELVDFHQPVENRGLKLTVFGCWTSLIHGVCEALIVIPFYAATLSGGELIRVVLLLVCVGSFVHSMIDYAISLIIWKPLSGTMRKSSVTA
ncbi:hypothetical protein NE562_16195 [Butyricicoccus faecihominis]|uniref:hypothetical protein n=1 Tax=Butyricicoccaceae TaxID=3085642 RepID=UPI00247A2748|nr:MULTISPECIES: hypothetical protein [Butyricicoccaceae]MCQ5131199.1 hypothetical protein [Butyricicoccus faecihominis]WNX83641.1 hypothetical protein RWV98_13715 [Agathobaculum sp. NTUH-O15-33]